MGGRGSAMSTPLHPSAKRVCSILVFKMSRCWPTARLSDDSRLACLGRGREWNTALTKNHSQEITLVWEAVALLCPPLSILLLNADPEERGKHQVYVPSLFSR
jgi:hypothetical protein